MKKIYQFETTDPKRYLNIEAQQDLSDEIVMKIYCEDDEYILTFPKSEFIALCSLKELLISS
jgi:hypothetical protein